MAVARPPGPEPSHGTRNRYQLRRDPCRCPACKGANTAYVRRRRGRGPTPTHPPAGVTWSEPTLWPDPP